MEQLELTPSCQPGNVVWKPTRALPPSVRAFGKFIATQNLMPGDLMLSREITPDRVSKMIVDVQMAGGYDELDARWTHVAMYVGDDQHIVEATFDSVSSGGDVRLTRLDDYCGHHALRFRRSRHLQSERERWLLVVRAMTRIKMPYGLAEAARMWIDVKWKGKGFWSEAQKAPAQSAVICSTLYADAYNEATRRSLGEVNGACVPAWLSLSDEFEDVASEWTSIWRPPSLKVAQPSV